MRISDWSSDVCSSDLAAGEILPRRRQQHRDLQRKDMLAVQILVQAIIIARAISQQQGRRPPLPRIVAARKEFAMFGRKADIHPHPLVPAVRDRREPGVKRSEEHTSELQSLMRISYAVFCL